MQEYDIYDAEGNVDVDKCQAIADDIAYQEWKDLKLTDPDIYEEVYGNKTKKEDKKIKEAVNPKTGRPKIIFPWER